MSISGWLKSRRKRGAIRRYITHLGPLLASTYGKFDHYLPERVRKAIQENGFSADEAAYALAIFCTPKQFAADQKARGETAQYWPLRVEITAYDFRRGYDTSNPISGDGGLTCADNHAAGAG